MNKMAYDIELKLAIKASGCETKNDSVVAEAFTRAEREKRDWVGTVELQRYVTCVRHCLIVPKRERDSGCARTQTYNTACFPAPRLCSTLK